VLCGETHSVGVCLRGNTSRVAESWTPPLHLGKIGGRCRLSLGGLAHGNGDTVEEAADDLVARLLNIIMCFRSSGLRIPAELGPPDHRWLEFLWELGELTARGEDIRERIFGRDPAFGASE
jgi:hypothetical protein